MAVSKIFLSLLLLISNLSWSKASDRDIIETNSFCHELAYFISIHISGFNREIVEANRLSDEYFNLSESSKIKEKGKQIQNKSKSHFDDALTFKDYIFEDWKMLNELCSSESKENYYQYLNK